MTESCDHIATDHSCYRCSFDARGRLPQMNNQQRSLVFIDREKQKLALPDHKQMPEADGSCQVVSHAVFSVVLEIGDKDK